MIPRLIGDVPARMGKLPVDPRGYPVPVIVLRDNGRAHFTINDEPTRQRMIEGDRCSICGGKLLRGRWFVGGVGSMLHADGVLIDSAMHDECAHYALRVCPYLAAPSYAKRIDAKTLPKGYGELFLDSTVDPSRPEVFVAAMAVGQKLLRATNGMVVYVKPKRPYRRLEFWRQGEQIDQPADLDELIAQAAERGRIERDDDGRQAMRIIRR